MLEIGSLFQNRYRVDKYVGRGGMADVYKAYDTYNHYDVAIKIVREDVENKEELYQRFSYEIRIAASVQNHFNIVRIVDFGKFEGTPFMITEFIYGQTLRALLDNRRTMEFKETCYIISQILDALNELHLRGIVHRDIKPQNVYVMSNGTVKVADFGISSFINESNNKISEKNVIVGTPQYVAPEIVLSGTVSPIGDIYATGVTFFEMLTGHVPFNDKDVHKICNMQVEKPLPDMTIFRPGIPSSLVKIVEKACEKDMRDRYQNVTEMKRDIELVLNDKKSLKSQNWFEKLLGLKGR